MLTYDILHIKSEGTIHNILYNEDSFVNIITLEDGYLVLTDGFVSCYDLDDTLVWDNQVENYVSLTEETDEYIILSNSINEYKIYNNGNVEENIHGEDYDFFSTIHHLNDGSRIVRTGPFESQGFAYVDQENKTIFEVETDFYSGISLYEDNFYYSTSNTEIIQVDLTGELIEKYTVDGVLQYITESGHFVLKTTTDEYDIETTTHLDTHFYFYEVTRNNRVMWTSHPVTAGDNLYDFGNGYQGVGERLSPFCAFHGAIFPPTYKSIIKYGEMIHEFGEYRGRILFIKNDSIFIQQAYLTEDEYHRNKIIEFDQDFNILNEYEFIGIDYGNTYAFKGNQLFIFTYTNIEAQ